MEEQTAMPSVGQSAVPSEESANLPKIKTLLAAKDDTQRFVGLALLKSVLDNTPALRDDTKTIRDLWESISPKFLDRLLRTGSKPGNADVRNMLDLSVSVLHTFAALLPPESTAQARFTARIPVLVASLLHSSFETTELILQLLQALVNSSDGSRAFVSTEDITPLIEIAPSHATALHVLLFAWHNAMDAPETRPSLKTQVGQAISGLASSFTGTDAATFLEFLADFLRDADPEILPDNPRWVQGAVAYIHSLVASRPNAKARAAYTNAAYYLLEAYPRETPSLLFADENHATAATPRGYLFVNLLLIDIRSSAPSLLQQLNDPSYPETSRRLASALMIVNLFIGFLVRSLEDENLPTMVMSPDHLLKLRKGISETISLVIEFLRDRWDASVAGAMGLHPDARSGEAATSTGTRHTLAWDAISSNSETDPLIGAAVGTLALWLQEDDNDTLRKEATGLTDMFLDLYQSRESTRFRYKEMVLVALNALMTLKKGRGVFAEQDGWSILSRDLASVVRTPGTPSDSDARRGIEIVRVLLAFVEEQTSQTTEQQMDMITAVAAWNPDTTRKPSDVVQEFYSAVLTLCCAVLERAAPGLRRGYVHSIHAIKGATRNLQRVVDEDLSDVLGQLA